MLISCVVATFLVALFIAIAYLLGKIFDPD